MSNDWLAGYHQALEDAAAACERHAKFREDEAHFGPGHFGELMVRSSEATLLAGRIRLMKDKGP